MRGILSNVLNKLVMYILQGRRTAFADAFYRFHEKRTARMLVWVGVQVVVASGFVALGFWRLFHGPSTLLPGLFTAAFLVMLVSSLVGAVEQLKVRVQPYFERPLGDVNAWDGGKSLLWHSRDLDQMAECLSLRPLSSFSSGDDLVQGEELQFHDATEALRTVEQLLSKAKKSRFSKELISDLTQLHDVLQSAAQKNVRFCLLLCEGHPSRCHETSARKGSFL